MMYQKAKLFEDDIIARLVLKCEIPAHIKKYGREVRNFLKNVWKENRENIIRDGNILKFNQNNNLREISFEYKRIYFG